MSNTYTNGNIGYGGMGYNVAWNYYTEVIAQNFSDHGVVTVEGTIEEQDAPHGHFTHSVGIRLDVSIIEVDDNPTVKTTFRIDGMDVTYATLNRAIEVASDECVRVLDSIVMQFLRSDEAV